MSPFNYTLNNPLNNYDPNGLTTWSVGISRGTAGKEIGGSMSLNWVWDDKGNAGLQISFGVGVVEGLAFVGTSINISKNSNNETIYETSGCGSAFGVIFGEGILGGVELNNFDFKNPNHTVAPGVGPGAAYGLITFTGLLFSGRSQDFQDVINNFFNGGTMSFDDKDWSITIYNKEGEFIKTMQLDDYKKQTTEPAMNKIWDEFQKRHRGIPLKGIVPERQPEGVVG